MGHFLAIQIQNYVEWWNSKWNKKGAGNSLNVYTKKSVLNRKLAVNDIFVIFGATLGKTDSWHE